MTSLAKKTSYRIMLTRRLIGWILIFLGTPVMAQVPFAHWTFDEGVIDSSLNTVRDNISGIESPWANTNTDGFNWSSSGFLSGALDFAGAASSFSDNYFDVAPLGLEDATAITWSAWIQPDSTQTSGYKGIFMTRELEDDTGPQQNYGIAWEDEGGGFGHVDARVSGLAIDSGSLPAEEWYHVAVVWDSDDINFNAFPYRELYINGVSVGMEIAGVPIDIIGEGGWQIGQDSCCPDRDFRGLLDDLAIFDEALTESDVMGLYTNGLNGRNAGGYIVDPPMPKSGDANLDCIIDLLDYDIINANMFTFGIRTDGDLNGDNFVDYEDFREWKIAFENQQQVPEPSAIVLLLAGLVGLKRRGRASL